MNSRFSADTGRYGFFDETGELRSRGDGCSATKFCDVCCDTTSPSLIGELEKQVFQLVLRKPIHEVSGGDALVAAVAHVKWAVLPETQAAIGPTYLKKTHARID